MTTIPLPFAAQAYTLDSTQFAAQRCINLFLEAGPAGSKVPVALLGIPGLTTYADVGDGPIRGLIELDGFVIVVSGTGVYRLSVNGTTLLLGLVTGSQPVKMASNGDQVLILAGTGAGDGYIATTTALTSITDVDFLGGSDCDFIDGFFVISVAGSNEWYISELYDGFNYDPLNFARAEGAPDNIRSLIVDHREIWLLGDETTEVWYNAGNPDFPFERASGTFLQRGCAARDSSVRLDNSLFWVGDDGIVYRANGYNPVRVSTHAIEQQINDAVSAGDLIAFGYSLEGHAQYVLKKPNQWTFVYDSATQLWHERCSCDQPDYKVSTFIAAFDRLLVGDDQSGRIYFLDTDRQGQEDTSTGSTVGIVVSRMAAPPLWANAQIASLNALVIDFEHGVGIGGGEQSQVLETEGGAVLETEAGQALQTTVQGVVGEDPQVMLRYSDDGGKTWSSEKWRNLGKIGEYAKRARWNRLGSFRQRVLEISISDPVKRTVMGAYAEVEGGRL